MDGDPITISAVAGAAGNVGAALVGTYGTLTLNADGTYSYAINNTNATVNALRLATDTLTDTFSYTITDAPPDSTLWAAAMGNQLATADAIRAQAIRLVGTFSRDSTSTWRNL